MGLDAFPVDERSLPRVTVSRQRLDEWKEVAHDEILRALTNRHSWYNAFNEKIRDGYAMIADKPRLKAFIRGIPNSSDKNVLVRASLESTTLDDIVYGVYGETTYDVRCAFAHMYEEPFLDGGILHTHETRTTEDPMHFVGIKWIAFRTPAQALMTSRDFVYFTYDGTAIDADGHRVVFRFLRTMPMDDIPIDDSKLPPLIRGKISNLHLYRQNGSHVDVFTKAMHSNAGNMPSWVVTKTISFMYPGVTNMATVADARALLHHGLTGLNPHRASRHSGAMSFSSTGSTYGVPSSSSGRAMAATLAAPNACSVCFHKFKITRSKKQCRSCHRTVCKRCTRSLCFFDEQKLVSSTGVARLSFCLNCIRHARNEASLARSEQQMVFTESSRSTGSIDRLDSARSAGQSSNQFSRSHHSQFSRSQGSATYSQDSMSQSQTFNSSYHTTALSKSHSSNERASGNPSSLSSSTYRVPSTDKLSSYSEPAAELDPDLTDLHDSDPDDDDDDDDDEEEVDLDGFDDLDQLVRPTYDQYGDDFSISGSFDIGAPSFMSTISFSDEYEVDRDSHRTTNSTNNNVTEENVPRGSFIPLSSAIVPVSTGSRSQYGWTQQDHPPYSTAQTRSVTDQSLSTSPIGLTRKTSAPQLLGYSATKRVPNRPLGGGSGHYRPQLQRAVSAQPTTNMHVNDLESTFRTRMVLNGNAPTTSPPSSSQQFYHT